MSDNSIPTSPGGEQPAPPPAPPLAPAPPAYPHQAAPAQPPQIYPGTAPTQQTQAYPGAAPTQAYPGAAPTFSPAQQPYGAAAVQPYGTASQHPQYSAPGQPGAGYLAYAAPVYAAPRPASGLAITSLICGIAGLVLFWAVIPMVASIVAVITGHMALRQTKNNPAIGGRGLAFAGLIMGYIMVAVLAITIVMTVVSFAFFGAFTLPFIFSS
ncbi:DUF4190 domain-containing protein [Microbacterium sp. 22215]|uniref:DUF4190 domain-containing protein n=1 Tax=Microbacterium sp. 22215 TaxID=3453893 RepID=UPI003F87EADD